MSKELTLESLIMLRLSYAQMELPPSANKSSSLSERFLLPPFSVLNARNGWWQDRKKAWIELGIQSELGRGSNGEAAAPGGHNLPAAELNEDGRTRRGDGRGRPMAKTYNSGGPSDLANSLQRKGERKGAHLVPGRGTGKNSAWMYRHEGGLYKSAKELEAEGVDTSDGAARGRGRNLYNAYDSKTDEVSKKIMEVQQQSGTSIFDPVLCELIYRWFTPPNARILDPFAGGSVRGIVAAMLGRSYTGIDLRDEQTEANYKQAELICPNADLSWITGDAANIPLLIPTTQYDFIFSCPPYADLERYSDDPRDLSTMEYSSFLRKYSAIIGMACEKLKEDRFACFVVGDIRDRVTGNYRGFVGDTITAFRNAGMELYNEAILVTAVGSLPIRVGAQFRGYRKLGKTHQNILVFLKGDARRATMACGEVDVDDLSMPDYEPGMIVMCQHDALETIAAEYFANEGLDTFVIDLPHTEACLLVDIANIQAKLSGRPSIRCWIGTETGWQRIPLEGDTELTYIVNGKVYLNRTLFPHAQGPPCSAPTVPTL